VHWYVPFVDSNADFCSLHTGAECVVVSVDYRLAPEDPYPSAVQDAVEALQWVYSRGESEVGVDLNRIAVGGSSRQVSAYYLNIYDPNFRSAVAT